MYLHIGKDILIQKKDIVGIFDYEKLEQSKNLQQIIEQIKKEGKIEDISEANPKSIILIQKKSKIHAYISNISSVTLAKRNKDLN